MRKILYLIILLVTISCSNNKYKQEKRFLENYSKGLSQFSNSLTDHFPGTIKDEQQLIVGYPEGAYGAGMAYIIFSHQVDSTEFNGVLRKLDLNKIKCYTPTYSAFIIIGDTLDYTEKINGIPIPSFESYERDFGLNSKHLTEKHKLYILESKSGGFMNKKYLTSNKNLPEKWKNGYSRGIATNKNENEIIYWLCVW